MTSDAPVARRALSDEPLSTRVVRRVAAVTDREVIQLPPLYDAVDPDALDALVDADSTDPSPLVIQFTYADHVVTIDETGAVDIEPTD